MTTKIALGQMHVYGGNKQRNLDHAEEMIAEATANGADLVLLQSGQTARKSYKANMAAMQKQFYILTSPRLNPKFALRKLS